jgi:hypothetical protein
MAQDNHNEYYRVAQIHFRHFIELSDVLVTLRGIDQLYCELAFLDATQKEQILLADMQPDSEAWIAQVMQKVATDLIEVLSSRTFDPRLAVQGTDSEPKIVTAHSGGSWNVDLFGKLNPIENIKAIMEMLREWKSDKDKKRLLSSKIGQELIRQDISERIAQIPVIRKTAEILRQQKVAEDDVQRLLGSRVASLAEGVLLFVHRTQSIKIIDLDKYRQVISAGKSDINFTSFLNEHDALPSLWSVQNW